ncbi:SusC/RagA family TonB-linked outer membrane protein [Hymenobacter sedentarius]|uniref:SusC/RagA family TonB-linked outer membrane protein n=1 Tax=Hymenobacter sedentarius TaxID=1411621 RepID=A0A0U3JTG4_9BACT|nr:TonB-dependent receptor [Hymenobacter sedentarius]ALW83967.1 SusC/RagA family TonB-linked outer membrane protein [Hymenobacter sedentarius]
MKKHFLLLWLLLFGSIGLAMAQSRQIQGVVKSAEGEPLPGVTVLVEGTTNGSSTGGDGAYNITLPAASAATAKLRFSYVGFTSKEVTVGDQSTINVTLASDSKQLEDVVVIGYQEVQRRDVTGSVSSVGAQQIKDVPVNSAAEALTGRLAGVQLTSAEGTPGNANVQIRVRGGGSITQDNSPLYVVDGIQVENALSVISPQDIASVDVLKDASATAIYGARGANGVVIITTKKGRDGKVVVSYNGFAGVRQLARKLDLMKPADYVDYQFERAQSVGTAAGGINTFKTAFGSKNFLSDTLNRSRSAPFLDWQDQVFGRDAFQQTHNFSVAGGVKGTTYSLSLTDNHEDGIQRGSNYDRKLANFRFDTKASDKFSFGLNARFNNQETNGSGTSSALSTITSRLRNAVQFQPLAVPLAGALDPTQFDEDFFQQSSLVNPVIAIDNEYRLDRRRTTNLSGNVALTLVPGLVVRSTAGFDITDSRLETFNGRYSPTIRQVAGNYAALPFASLSTGVQTTINNSNVVSYTYKTGRHSLDGLLGQEIYQQQGTVQYIQTNFLPLDITARQAIANINQGVLPAGTVAQPNLPTTGEPVKSRLLSGFGRLNYTFADKYLATLTFRADGSSKYAPGNRVGYFPAASLAWRVSQEEFLKPLTVISDLKIRLSYGKAGNNRINDFSYLRLLSGGGGEYWLNHIRVGGANVPFLENPNLKWETTVSRNLGMDLALFNNRLQLTADVYYNTTQDLLVARPIPVITGYASQLQNIGSTSNRGLELQLSGTVMQTPDFTWTANFNTSFNRGRIEDLGGAPEIPGVYSGWASTAISQDFVARVGSPIGLMYGYVTDFDNGRKGFYTVDDFEGYNATTKAWTLKSGVASDVGVQGQTLAPGIIKLKDLNGDGIVNELDRTVIGNANPKLTGGFNQQFTYKGFDASVFLNFVYGNDVYNANKLEFTSAINPLSNMLALMNDRYRTIDANGAPITDPNTSRDLNQNAQIWQPTRQLFTHSWAIENGSFLRVNNVTLGYSLPKALISRAKLTQLRFYVTTNNLYTFTKYTGYDPEANTRRATGLTPGVDYAAYPRSRAFLFGVNLAL